MNSELGPVVLDPRDRHLIQELCFRLTGSRPDTEARLEACYVNLLRRMRASGAKNLRAYLHAARDRAEEFAELLSALTIHTTSWFRERPHFERLLEQAKAHIEKQRESEEQSPQPFRVLSAACSSGEEVFSIALVLEALRERQPGFDYAIEGWDLDPVSIGRAERAIYEQSVLEQIPSEFRRHLRLGQPGSEAEGLFTLSPNIRARCQFAVRSIDQALPLERSFQLIFCRNVLIYFRAEQVERIVRSLLQLLRPEGRLFLGHSEGIEAAKFGLRNTGNTVYARESGPSKSRASEPKMELRYPELILIGASTGGTEALLRLLRDMPDTCPPVLVVQHIARSFAKSFAERLTAAAGLRLGQPLAGSELKPGHLYMAWDEYHIGLRPRGEHWQLQTSLSPPLHSMRPAVDFLFESAAQQPRAAQMMGILLTGMGKDGARGLLQLKHAGAMTFTQDEASSVVYGMPGEASALGASAFSGSPEQIRQLMNQALRLPRPLRSQSRSA